METTTAEFAIVKFKENENEKFILSDHQIVINEDSTEFDEYYALIVTKEDDYNKSLEFIDSMRGDLYDPKSYQKEYVAYAYSSFTSLEYALYHLGDSINVVGEDFEYLKSVDYTHFLSGEVRYPSRKPLEMSDTSSLDNLDPEIEKILFEEDPEVIAAEICENMFEHK